MAALVPIVYAIKEFAVHGIVGLAPALFGVGVLFAVLFVRRQLRLETPMLDMALFRRGSFSGAILVNLLSVIALVGFLFFVAQHLQLIVGLSPLEAGLALVPGLVAMIAAGLLVVPLAKRFSSRVIVPAGLAVSVLAYVTIAVTAQDGEVWVLSLAFVALGIGIGMAETVSNELILSSAPPEKAGAASAVSETAYELGAVLGTAVLGGLLTALYRGSLVLPDGVPAEAVEAARETLAGAVAAGRELDPGMAQQLRDAAAHAFDAGVGVTALIGAGLIVIAAVIAATTLERTASASEH
jgi:DHA2 family multidrug resistance protein-like MFS transporter